VAAESGRNKFRERAVKSFKKHSEIGGMYEVEKPGRSGDLGNLRFCRPSSCMYAPDARSIPEPEDPKQTDGK